MSERHPYSLIGIDGNAFSVMGYTMKAMRQCGYSNDAIQCYREDAMSGDYDNLLALSCTMIDNCNVLSGFDQFQQFMKGHDDLEYVDSGHMGVQNKHEKLINEGIMDDLLFGFSETPSSLSFEDEYKNDDYYTSKNYLELYNAISSSLIFILNNLISDGNDGFSKEDIKRCLLDIIQENAFWDELEYEVQDKRINESFGVEQVLYGKLRQRLLQKFNELLENNIEFSKYDVKHAILQIMGSPIFWDKLDKYIKD